MITTQKGGIPQRQVHDRTVERGFWNAAVPSACVVPLQQHRGSLVKPVVKVGDIVREGMIVADGDGRLAIPVHAPIPGRVSAIGPIRLFDNSESIGIEIELAGEFDRLGKKRSRRDWSYLEAGDIRRIVREAGVVAGSRWPVPVHEYLNVGTQAASTTLVLDLAETEPWLTADYELVRAVPEEIAEGLRVILKMTGIEQLHVVAANSFRDAAALLRRALGREARFHTVENRFPANLESHLRRIVFARSEAAGTDQILTRVSPDTVHSVYEAVVLGKAQLDRVICVAGGAVARPAHVRVRYGTSVADVLAECGGLTTEPAKIVAGGPFTGMTVQNILAPVYKTTSAILALTAAEISQAPERPCIGCGACTRACPVSINPRMLQELVRAERFDDAAAAGVNQCVECGICSYVCPSRIPLVQLMRAGKGGTDPQP